MSKSGLRRRNRLFEIIEVGNDLDPVSRSYDFISVGTICELGLDDALKFLRKQDLDAGLFEDGINLVKYDALPLGFVKRVGNRVNNMYPNSLRILK